jgi:hypothetical protein
MLGDVILAAEEVLCQWSEIRGFFGPQAEISGVFGGFDDPFPGSPWS